MGLPGAACSAVGDGAAAQGCAEASRQEWRRRCSRPAALMPLPSTIRTPVDATARVAGNIPLLTMPAMPGTGGVVRIAHYCPILTVGRGSIGGWEGRQPQPGPSAVSAGSGQVHVRAQPATPRCGGAEVVMPVVMVAVRGTRVAGDSAATTIRAEPRYPARIVWAGIGEPAYVMQLKVGLARGRLE